MQVGFKVYITLCIIKVTLLEGKEQLAFLLLKTSLKHKHLLTHSLASMISAANGGACWPAKDRALG